MTQSNQYFLTIPLTAFEDLSQKHAPFGAENGSKKPFAKKWPTDNKMCISNLEKLVALF